MEKTTRTGELVMGDTTQSYFFNDNLIAGLDFSLVDHTRSKEFEQVLSESGLERVAGNSTRQVGREVQHTFILFKYKNNQPFSKKNDRALLSLRSRFGDSYGPVVLNGRHDLQGALQNQLIVKFASEVPEDEVQKILKEYQAENIHFMVDQQAYLVTFPKDWGYEIVDVGKRLLADRHITYVENQYYAIPKR